MIKESMKGGTIVEFKENLDSETVQVVRVFGPNTNDPRIAGYLQTPVSLEPLSLAFSDICYYLQEAQG